MSEYADPPKVDWPGESSLFFSSKDGKGELFPGVGEKLFSPRTDLGKPVILRLGR